MATRSPYQLIEKLRQRRATHKQKNPVYRIGFGFAGFVIALTGLAMLVLPGPALVVLPVGLFMLALEFNWAEKLLETTLNKADGARRSVASRIPIELAIAGVLIGFAAALVAIWAFLR